jgi:hypothetical protein
MGSIRFTAAALSLLFAACSDNAAQYQKKANALLAANEVAGAEATLKEGIVRHPEDRALPTALLELYIKSNQPLEIRRYLSLMDDKLNNYAQAEAYIALAMDANHQRNWQSQFSDTQNATQLLSTIAQSSRRDTHCELTSRLYMDMLSAAAKLNDRQKYVSTAKAFTEFNSGGFCARDKITELVARQMNEIVSQSSK